MRNRATLKQAALCDIVKYYEHYVANFECNLTKIWGKQQH